MATLKIVGNQAWINGMQYACTIGRAGYTDNKQEGDGATPEGIFPLRQVFYRADRLKKPVTNLPVLALRPDDGWCDAPDSLFYNRWVKTPFPASHEALWREDHAYDLIVVVGYNDAPVVSGCGSAIFLHLCHDDERATAGCVAFTQDVLYPILAEMCPRTTVQFSC